MGGSSTSKYHTEVISEDNLIAVLKASFDTFNKSSLGTDGGKLRLSTSTLTIINDLIEHEQSVAQVANLRVNSHFHTERQHWRLPCGLVTQLGSSVAQDVAFIRTVVESIQHLVISNTSGTIQGYVNVRKFTSLRFLELRNVPLHLIQNLKYLRSSLKGITVFRCIESTRSLFETCGGDQSFAANWTELTSADLQNNNLSCVDDGMRLLNSLTVLDLSRNALKDAHGLQYLHCLESVNLSYNFLTYLPSFSAHTKHLLKVILIAFNSLDNLAGIGRQPVLRVLDVRDNCITTFSDLKDIGALNCLTKLRIKDNPLTSDPTYRKKLIGFLCANVDIRLEVDSRPLDHKEREELHHRHISPRPGGQDAPVSLDGSSVFCTSTNETVVLDEPHTTSSFSGGPANRRPTEEEEGSGGSDADVSSLDVEVAGYFNENRRPRRLTHRRRSGDTEPDQSKPRHDGTHIRRVFSNSTTLSDVTQDPNSLVFSPSCDLCQRPQSNALYGPSSISSLDHGRSHSVDIQPQSTLQWCNGSPIIPSFLTDGDNAPGNLTGNRFHVWAKLPTDEAMIGGEVELTVARSHWLVTIDPSHSMQRVIECLDLRLLDGLKRESVTEAAFILSVYFRYHRMKHRARTYRFNSVDKLNELVSSLQPFLTTPASINPATHDLPITKALMTTCPQCGTEFLHSDCTLSTSPAACCPHCQNLRSNGPSALLSSTLKVEVEDHRASSCGSPSGNGDQRDDNKEERSMTLDDTKKSSSSSRFETCTNSGLENGLTTDGYTTAKSAFIVSHLEGKTNRDTS